MDEEVKNTENETKPKKKSAAEILKAENAELKDSLLRSAAEFENFKKRTAKERELLYGDAKAAAVSQFLVCIDSFEIAMAALSKDNSEINKGIELIYSQFKSALTALGVEEIDTKGKKFDPEFHEAIMHIEDEKYGQNEIAEEFKKGYILGDRVLRHSMVKVAN